MDRQVDGMSWKCSRHYWECRIASLHVFSHALDHKSRLFYVVRWRAHEWQVWPPRYLLDSDTEWTLPAREDLARQITHLMRLYQRNYGA